MRDNQRDELGWLQPSQIVTVDPFQLVLVEDCRRLIDSVQSKLRDELCRIEKFQSIRLWSPTQQYQIIDHGVRQIALPAKLL